MSFKKPTGPICQSCSLPIETDDDKGTETDKMLNDDYCSGCYEAGEFIDPEITLKEMIERNISPTAKSFSITLEEAKQYLESLMPTLKRWR